MRLVIGGYAQGKLEYVLQKYHLQEDAVWDAGLCADKTGMGTVVINHLHSWVRQRLLEGGIPEEEIWTLVGQFDDCIVISDEVGNGIVPVDPMEREYRERLGRILIQLADRAEGVERVICGIGQTIK
ncbi:MAG: bifunctional adenosylcobinamide kinase/adenosylcobinamide-phosphate guanylyltransferase [Eubacterium sp.]|nr:bifunctional adenosylcobinamide kinase/adenosylcobinamide-phosphate guanylyltransferase [Eubacterium sp.]